MTGPQQYQVQFSTSEEHVQLIERAKSLLAREAPGKSLGELHLQAMKLLVAALEKQKYALTERPRKRGQTPANGPQQAQKGKPDQGAPQPTAHASAAAPDAPDAPDAPVAAAGTAAAPAESVRTAARPATPPRQRSRRVPADVRRVVFQRDGGRCSYVDERGERCRETCGLELHHRQPFGKEGDHAVSNLTLHCPAHNALAAELDFGRQYMAECRDAQRHGSLASEHRSLGDERLAPR